MPVNTRYVFIANMDVDADKEDLFNEVYDQEHVPLLLEVPGVLSVTRFTSEPLTMVIGGERRTIDAPGEPKYTAVYEIESPEVLVSDAWAAAIDRGRWSTQVRPYTRNRRHTLKKVM
ncbi:MAG: hypothetical protein GTO67_11125 [Gammaproteobacteria bacterium]|nr:hypothetical protein [Gammaproteobacteria bacterium]NIM72246.1 hypothetical protein [Gammaproteobacteria bacterium]NIN39161.1 hypothetical protein [Gammaproteobacteria bacterium]NIO23994.1 hypothetical protein [Gammaproteobacteria bacterium]NIO64646.1 hypothetical protein [Gammaproteobacteria bacterium]